MLIPQKLVDEICHNEIIAIQVRLRNLGQKKIAHMSTWMKDNSDPDRTQADVAAAEVT